MAELNGYKLSRQWFDFCFENPEKIRPIHTSIYFFAIEHCNRLGWKKKFGFPSQMAMEALGIRNWRTYQKALNEIIDFGFIEMIEKSKNQYSSNIIAIVKNTKAHTKALDKALQKHSQKQVRSTDSINKQRTKNKEQLNNKQKYPDFFSKKLISVYNEFLKLRKEKRTTITKTQEPRFLKKLERLSNKDPALAEKILVQSIENGWQGIFDLKEQVNNNESHKIDKTIYDSEDPEKMNF